MGVILFAFILVIVVAVVFSVPVLIPPIRRRLRENQLWRRVSIGVLSTLTVVFMVWFMVYAPASIATIFYMQPRGLGQPELPTEQIQAVTNELWLRRITPPVIRKYCMTGDESICAIADEMEAQDIALNSNQDWGSYLGMWLMILAPAVATGLLVHYFTRDNRKQKQKTEL
jgi:hypothetical protein